MSSEGTTSADTIIGDAGTPTPAPTPPGTAPPAAKKPGRSNLLATPATASRIPPALQARMANMMKNRGSPVEGVTNAMARTNLNEHPTLRAAHSAPAPPRAPGGMKRLKPGFKLSDMNGDNVPGGDGASAAGLGVGRPDQDSRPWPPRGPASGTPFANFSKIVDPSGALRFGGKAVIHASGVNFSSGSSFSISMTEMQLEDELGKGNYGTVKKVLHKPTNVQMAMKEIRLELDDSHLNAIIMELDILHRAVAPQIVEFYGAFFIESCVYYCMEFMDAGSLDKLYRVGVPEAVLARISGSMVRGLKFLKDELQIMHRDVKPTNVLVNSKGNVKLCDFGVSGQLERSLAKTNIGCQSYMAPERIKGESMNNVTSYTVSSDVWSLGLSIIEIATGAYPYPPETYANVFAQLQAIVHGDPPTIPTDSQYSSNASDFVDKCLIKQASKRAAYAELLEHPFLVQDRDREVDMVGWVQRALEYRANRSLAPLPTS